MPPLIHQAFLASLVAQAFPPTVAGASDAGQRPGCPAARATLPGGLSLLQERTVRLLRSTGAEADDEAGWLDPDIILDAGKWRRLPESPTQQGDPRPPAPLLNLSDASAQSRARIVVLIAALRESRTVSALLSLFETARHPSRVFVGVVQQNAAGDEDAAEGLCRRLGTPLERLPAFGGQSAHRRLPGEDDWGQGRFTTESLAACGPASRIRTYRMDSGEAAGPVYARAQQRRLLTPGSGMEDFCLQIDAHAVFSHGWDERLLQQFAQTENEYAVLTTYPTDAATMLDDGTFPNVNNHWEMPHLCGARVLGRGVVRNDRASAAANLQRPALGKLWAAGLSFSRCHAERDVPSDPHLKQVFDGEEFSRGARLWTNGYDFYSLSRPVLGVYYGTEKGNKGGWHHVQSETASSDNRLEELLCLNASTPRPEALQGFDLGKRRRFQDYLALTGIDTIHHVTKQTSCVVRRWTPWLEGSQPPYEILRDAPPPLGN